MHRVTIITGAAGGIGAATARHLAGAGHAIGVLDLNLDDCEALAAELRSGGATVAAAAFDTTAPDSVESALDAVEAEIGPVTSLVTAAGITRTEDFLALTYESWKRTIAINLTGTWLMTQRVARRMVAGGHGGAIVALSSVAGRGPRANAADYAASKAGVISLVRSAAVALAPSEIRVNAICPGVVETPMTMSIHEKAGRERSITPAVSLAELVATVPLGRMQSPDEVAHVIGFLLSDAASYVTGQALNACGGLEFN